MRLINLAKLIFWKRNTGHFWATAIPNGTKQPVVTYQRSNGSNLDESCKRQNHMSSFRGSYGSFRYYVILIVFWSLLIFFSCADILLLESPPTPNEHAMTHGNDRSCALKGGINATNTEFNTIPFVHFGHECRR